MRSKEKNPSPTPALRVYHSLVVHRRPHCSSQDTENGVSSPRVALCKHPRATSGMTEHLETSRHPLTHHSRCLADRAVTGERRRLGSLGGAQGPGSRGHGGRDDGGGKGAGCHGGWPLWVSLSENGRRTQAKGGGGVVIKKDNVQGKWYCWRPGGARHVCPRLEPT